jgi:hypothetical protein
VDDPVDQPGQRHDRQQHPGDVEPARGGVARLGDDASVRDHAEHGDRHRDEEDRAPPEVLEHRAAGQRAAGDGDPGRAAHTPIARPRSAGGKTLVMTARVVGWTAAPPMPMTARQAISSSGLR